MMWYGMTWYDMTGYGIIWDDIILYHITSYDKCIYVFKNILSNSY